MSDAAAFRASVLIRERAAGLHAKFNDRLIKAGARCLCGGNKPAGRNFSCTDCFASAPSHIRGGLDRNQDRKIRRRCAQLLMDHADRRNVARASSLRIP